MVTKSVSLGWVVVLFLFLSNLFLLHALLNQTQHPAPIDTPPEAQHLQAVVTDLSSQIEKLTFKTEEQKAEIAKLKQGPKAPAEVSLPASAPIDTTQHVANSGDMAKTMQETFRHQHHNALVLHRNMGDKLQASIRAKQNPPLSHCPTNDPNYRFLVCDLKKACGFGCQVHHLVYCLTTAWGSNRTLVLEEDGWKYSRQGWSHFFQPLSSVCDYKRDIQGKGIRVGSWSPDTEKRGEQFLRLAISDSMRGRHPMWTPYWVEESYMEALKPVHSDVPVWWVGQMVAYILQLNPYFEQQLQLKLKDIGFAHPIVGLHVRRSDKIGTEAQFHDIKEYMEHAKAYFDSIGTTGTRRIFIATDEPKLMAEAREKYPDYEFLSDNAVSQLAADISKRYSDDSLWGVVSDMHILSQCDFFVGTFSSQVSRIAYELMQTRHVDGTKYSNSLDDGWYFGK